METMCLSVTRCWLRDQSASGSGDGVVSLGFDDRVPGLVRHRVVVTLDIDVAGLVDLDGVGVPVDAHLGHGSCRGGVSIALDIKGLGVPAGDRVAVPVDLDVLAVTGDRHVHVVGLDVDVPAACAFDGNRVAGTGDLMLGSCHE